ncbi:MAG TPA: hypothetical protein VNN06_10575 [Ramlibacter sp.]|nr:hypothetical protein [Ramlibacter sp.]
MNNFNTPSRLPSVTRPPLGRTAGQALRRTALVLSMLLWAGTPALAQVSVGVSLPGVSIGINMPMYPQFVRVPNYPVYYAPRFRTNFFFYDGRYWVYEQDNWYTSSWYNGPWMLVAPRAVPLYVLRIPVRYYSNPPTYFRGWRPDAPPRWGEHWGNEWSQQRSGWDRWDRRAAPAPAPLPLYQRQYSGDRYPHVDLQQALQSRNYRYQPRDAVVRQQYQQAAPVGAVPPQHAQQAAPRRAPDLQGRPVVQGRTHQPEQSQQTPQVQQLQQTQLQQPQHSRQGAEGREAPAARGIDRAQGQAQGRGKAQGRDQDRDSENTPGQQHKK